uniref:Uncharacterized protein n=1 Tax=Lepeophtheirus salmonis TaxID=72036 RepID=A0A0K2TL12_LEPSM
MSRCLTEEQIGREGGRGKGNTYNFFPVLTKTLMKIHY